MKEVKETQNTLEKYGPLNQKNPCLHLGSILLQVS